MLTVSNATNRLIARYREQTLKFPLMKEISLKLYISRNISIVRRGNMLESYQRLNNA